MYLFILMYLSLMYLLDSFSSSKGKSDVSQQQATFPAAGNKFRVLFERMIIGYQILSDSRQQSQHNPTR